MRSARIAVRLLSFLPASFMLQGTEYVFTLTSTLARRFMRLSIIFRSWVLRDFVSITARTLLHLDAVSATIFFHL